ncbi:transforming acidic coiled-coil-containing protein 2 isoform X3 [Trachinotus anak]|uniref:transforming acidic coiled-coil-containing protein 2 isoform X3 n=1 Tax=Trachinotus anak TaxID=443729 RepID=UPI0039F20EED
MGNETSTTEALPEEGAPENVVLFPPQENQNDSLQAEAHAESLTQRDNRPLLCSDASTSQQTLPSQPVLPDVPVITGVEESRGAAGDQEDKEELEFPHDLLPSLDFSSELNIWESSLGAQTSSGERKCEQVNPLLAGLQHHMEVSGPLVVLDTRPHDSDPVLTDARPSPQPTSTPYPGVQPLTPTPLRLLDQELQEAFQECEEQMASLGILTPTENHSTTHELVHDAGKKTGDVMVNMSSESLSLPPVVVQPGHSNGGHGNKSTHGNSEAANSQKDTLVFSFRNYILGNENSAGAAQGKENEIKATQSSDDCPEMKPEKETEIDEQKETPPHTQLETATKSDPLKETPKDSAFTEQRHNLREKHAESHAATEEHGSLDCKTVIRDKGREAITETADIKTENYRDECSIVCVAEPEKKDDSVNEISGCNNLQIKDKDALSELQSEDRQTETGKHAEENQSKTDKETNSASDRQAVQDKEMRKKEKKKQRKKKKMEKRAEAIQKEKTAVQSESDLQAESLRDAGIHADSEANVPSASQTDTQALICGEQPDNGFDYKGQLSPTGKPSSSPPLSSSHSRQDHLTASVCSPASSQAPTQGPHQSDNHNHMDAPCGTNQSSDENPQRKQHATGDVINNQNTPITCVQTTAINPLASADTRSDAQTQEAIVTTEASILTEENQSPLSNGQTCVGESCVESALEEASVVVAVLPLTTPTMPEVIESNGEGESVRCDSLKSVAAVEFEESEEAAGEKGSGGIDKCLSSADGERDGLLDSPTRLSLICSQGKCPLAFSAKEGQAAFEKSCSSKMPHNSATETEMRGQRDTTVHSANVEIPPAEEGDREKEPLRLEAYINTSPLGLLTGPDCQAQSAVGLEEAGEGGGGGGGGGEEVGEKGRLAREHSSFSQPGGSVSGVSSAETETCPPTDVAESQLKSQSRSEPIATITESICTEQDRLSHPCQEHHGAAISPLPTQSSSNTNGGVRADLKKDLISEEALSLGHGSEESSITETERNYGQALLSLIKPQPLTTSQQIPVERQASNNQQVQPESSTTEARTAKSAAEIQVQAQAQSNSGSSTMSGVGVYVCGSSGGKNRVHFADTVKQEGSSSVDLRSRSVPSMDCASLPPLTVHESLHHPVVEASYIFPDFLSVKKPEILTNAAPTKDEPAKQSPADFPKPQKNVQSERGDLETEDTKENIAIDQSGNDNLGTNTVDLQPVTETCTKQLPSPAEKNQTGNEECFDLLPTAGSAISEADHVTVEQVSAKVIKQEEAETEKGPINLSSSKEKEPNEFHAVSTDSVKSDQPQDSPLISVIPEEKEGNQQPLSSRTVLPADDVTGEPLSDDTELPVEQLSADLDLSSKPEPVNLTCTASLQTEPGDPSYQLHTQLDKTPPCGLVSTDPMRASEGPGSTIHAADQTEGESVTSEVTASDQSIPVIEQRAINPAFVLRPPGPMLSHLEFITDSDVCLPEQTDKRGADGDGTKVSGEVDDSKSGEMTQMSSAQDLEHVDVSVKADETDPKLEDRHYAKESVNELEKSAIKNENIPFSQEENLTSPIQPPGAVGAMAKDESDNVISPSQTEPDSIAIKPVICEGSIRDGLVNVSCPLSSDLPSDKAYDEIKKDNMKEKHKAGDQTPVQIEKDKKQGEDATVTEDQLQPPHTLKVKMSESPMRDIKEEGERKSEIASKSETESSSLSPSRPAGSSEDTLLTEVESGSEPQTVYNQSLSQTPTATLERSSDSNTAQDLSAALGQSLSTMDPNSFAQQQEKQQQQQQQQQQQRLASRHPTEELSGGCLEEVEKTQALVPGVKGVAEEEDGSVASMCQSGSRGELTCDDSGGSEQVIGLEKGEGEGARAVKEADRVYVPSHSGNDLNESGKAAERNASADIVIVTTSSHEGEKGQAMGENKSLEVGFVSSDADLKPGSEFVSDMSGKGQQKSNLSAPCQDQHGKTETSTNTAASVESASQEHETSTSQISVSSKVSTDSKDIHTEVAPRANQAEEIHTEISSALPESVGQPESVEKDFGAALAVKSNSSETEECEILDTVCEPLELQSPNKTSATQSDPAVQTPIKGSDVEEITRRDKAALDQEKASSHGKGQSQIKVINSEATEKQGVGNQTVSAKDSGSGPVNTSDLCESDVSHSSSEPTVALSKATESDSDVTDRITPDVITVPVADLSKSLEDSASIEKPLDQAALSKPLDVIVVNPIVAASLCEGKPLPPAPACTPPVEQPPVNTEDGDVSESPAQAPEPETNWIKALKDAASHSQGEQLHTMEASRALPSLESPQLEFQTPTEEIVAPLTQEEIPPPEQAEDKTTEIPPLNLPLDLPEPLKKSVDLPEPTQQEEELSEPTQSTEEELPEPTQKTVELSEPTQSTEEELPEPTQKTVELSEPTQSTEEELPEPTQKTAELSEPTQSTEEELPEPTQKTAELSEPTQSTEEELPEPTQKTAELSEPTQSTEEELPEPTQKTAELSEPRQSTEEELPEPTKKEEEPPGEYPEAKAEPETSLETVEEPAKTLEPAKSTEELPEPTKNEEPEPTKVTKEPLEPEKNLISEVLVEKPAESPPVELFKEPADETAVTETVQDPAEELQDSRPFLAEEAQRGDRPPDSPLPPTSEHHFLPAPLPHLHESAEFPTPPPTPPERHTPEVLPTPPASPHLPPPPAPSSPPTFEGPCPTSAPHHALRSSDSDGAFETPESTTPVKAVSPTDPQTQQLTSDDKVADTSVSELAYDLTSTDRPCRSPSIGFDENKPIAASGTYNIDLFAADSASHTLTRSLSLQGGELDSSGLVDGSTTAGFRPHSESFSVGTESAPGTLHRPKKVRPGSVKKKPLLRQNSNPESPRPASSSSTPEIKKRAKPRTASPLLAQEEAEGSATPSPGGTLRRARKSRVETPPPLPEETNHTSQEESLVIPALPLCHEETPLPGSPTDKDESPIPPCASYKWDPENFENIDPFNTGGSKIANSPVLGRKDPLCASIATPVESTPVPAVEPSHSSPTAPLDEPVNDPEEQPIIPKRQSVRLEFDYSEESSEASHQASPPPKKVGKKPGAKMPLRKPKLGLKKAPPAQTQQLDNDPPATHNGNENEIPVPKATYNFETDKWDDPNFNPFTSKRGIANSPKLSRPSYSFDPNNFDDSIDPFKSSNTMSNSPPKASASFELSSNDYDNENDNDNIGELEDQNQNKPAKKKKTPIKSNTFRVKRSPKKSPLSDTSQDPTPVDEPPSLHSQDDHATDEEKLASSTSHKWAALNDMDADLNSDQQEFPQPCDLTSFVNENSLPHQTLVQDYEIEYMEKIGSSSPPLPVKKPSLYLKLDSVSDSLTKNTCAHGSEPSSPCTGSFEEMEAQITAGMKTPVLSSRPGPEGCAGDKGRKRESESLSRTQSTERDEQSPSQGPTEAPAPALAMPLLDRLSECDDPLQYLEPDLAETNPTAFAQKLQEELVLAALRIEALQVAKNISQCPSLSTVTPQHRDVSSPVESAVSKSSLYARTTTTTNTSCYIEGESPHLPRDLDHSLGIAREEIVSKEKEVLEWQRKYEDSRQEVVEMRRIVAEYEKTIAQMIEDDQKEKSLSHHTIQQLIMEKDQALADLNSVEKSLADLFRRYEKMKDVLEGFRKNEEVLKKCAQEYLSRVRKEEQRYQALKIHAEEKLDKANAEIAQVRAKAKQEQAAYQASLRKEQMKVDSLERTLEQKNKEIEELTKICDELIAKMGRS